MNAEWAIFTVNELRRVGVAATMLVICGALIILTMTAMLGHYNSLAHSGPKAVLDGAVITLLIGQKARWRCLALLGAVYGLVLLFQVGVFYLLPVMFFAGATAAMVGRSADLLSRSAAVYAAAMVFELLAGFGAPIKIYFGTGGRSEPILWGLWFAEWPLRIAGAAAGVCLAKQWRGQPDERGQQTSLQPHVTRRAATSKSRRRKGIIHTAISLLACIIACTVPMLIDSTLGLGLLGVASTVYALWSGVRWRLLHALVGLSGSWAAFGLMSFAWHQSANHVWDMSRTLVLRFMPATFSALVMVTTVRPVEAMRLLRRLRVSQVVLIPLSRVLRSLPESRRTMQRSIELLRAEGHWKGPLSLLRNPLRIARELLGPPIKRWANQLREESAD